MPTSSAFARRTHVRQNARTLVEIFVAVFKVDVELSGDSSARNKAGLGLEAGQDVGGIQPSCPSASHGEEDHYPCIK